MKHYIKNIPAMIVACLLLASCNKQIHTSASYVQNGAHSYAIRVDVNHVAGGNVFKMAVNYIADSGDSTNISRISSLPNIIFGDSVFSDNSFELLFDDSLDFIRYKQQYTGSLKIGLSNGTDAHYVQLTLPDSFFIQRQASGKELIINIEGKPSYTLNWKGFETTKNLTLSIAGNDPTGKPFQKIISIKNSGSYVIPANTLKQFSSDKNLLLRLYTTEQEEQPFKDGSKLSVRVSISSSLTLMWK